MRLGVEEIGPCKKKIKVEVPPEKIREEFDKGMVELMRSAKIPGFRPGHAPRRLLEKRYGKRLEEEVKGTLIAKSFSEALEDLNLKTIGEPNIENIEFEPNAKLSYEATVEVKPTFDLDGYDNFELEKNDTEVKEEEIENALQDIRKQAAEFKAVSEEGARKGDVISAEAELFAEGESIWREPGARFTTEARKFLGIELPDLESNLLGKKAGEEVRIPVELGSDFFQEQHRGKRGEVLFRLKEIQRPLYPEINDEFAKRLGFDSLGLLRERLREQIHLSKERSARSDLIHQIEEKLLEMVNFELPEGILKRLATESAARRELEMRYYGVSEERLQKEKEHLMNASRESAERQMRLYFILERIAEKEKIFATEQDVARRLEEIASSRNVKPARVRQELEEKGLMSELRGQIREEKVFDYLLSKANIRQKAQPAQEEGPSGEKGE